MKEKPFRYGERGEGIGTVTLPKNLAGAPVVVFLNAGLLHRAEPYRLNVELSRELASLGYICIRLDLANKGDSPVREGMTNRESVALDWSFISKEIEQSFGKRNLLIFGLCSGADNGVKLACIDKALKGLILLDPDSPKDNKFGQRQLMSKVSNPYRWLNLIKGILSGAFFKRFNARETNRVNLRDAPTSDDLHECFRELITRDGKVLAVFTGTATRHYNQLGQFVRTIGIEGLAEHCDEVFLPHAGHIFPIQEHRNELVSLVTTWARDNFQRFQTDIG